MKKLSDMNLMDIADFVQKLDMIEKKLRVESSCESARFFFESREEYMMRLKLAWITVFRLMQEIGVETGTTETIYIHCPLGDSDMDDEDEFLMNWQCCSEWAFNVVERFLCEHGFVEDELYAAFPIVCQDEALAMSVKSPESESLSGRSGRFLPYDYAEQVEVADFCSAFTDEVENFRCFRSLRLGRGFDVVERAYTDQDSLERQLSENLYQRLGYDMYRHIVGVTEPYVSSDDRAFVIRMMEFCGCETGEIITFALIRPFVMLDVVLMERFCEIMEESHIDTHSKLLMKEGLQDVG